MGSLQLAALQRRLAARIRDPEAIAEGSGPAEQGAAVADLVRGDARAAAGARLGVYASAYRTRIGDVLGRDFPVLAACLGADGFHDLVLLYLLAFPPDQPSLRFAGARLARFLEEHAAAEPFRRRWPFSPELARLEWALVDAFDAPDARCLSRQDLQQVPVLEFEHLELFLHPSATRLSLRWPVHRLLEANGSLASPSIPTLPQTTELVIWRRGEEPRFRALEPDEARVLDAAIHGAPFGALCELLAEELAPGAAPTRAAALLAAWTDDGLLRAPA